jgi:hypothetical protein
MTARLLAVEHLVLLRGITGEQSVLIVSVLAA